MLAAAATPTAQARVPALLAVTVKPAPSLSLVTTVTPMLVERAMLIAVVLDWRLLAAMAMFVRSSSLAMTVIPMPAARVIRNAAEPVLALLVVTV